MPWNPGEKADEEIAHPASYSLEIKTPVTLSD